MERNEMIRYLRTAMEMEGNAYLLDSVIREYDQSCRRRYRTPCYKNVSSSGGDNGAGVAYGVSVFGFFGVVFGVFGAILSNGALIAIGVVGLLAIIISIAAYFCNNKNKNQEFAIASSKVQQENQKIYNDCMAYNYALNRERAAILGKLSNERNVLQNNINSLYSLNIIYPKYRNLPALASFVEYFESGRCDELSGINGAYNIYENEIRQNIIIAQLSEVVHRLNEIKDTQYNLYSVMNSIQNTQASVARELNSINNCVNDISSLQLLNTIYIRMRDYNRQYR